LGIYEGGSQRRTDLPTGETLLGLEIDGLCVAELLVVLEQRRLYTGHHLPEGEFQLLVPAIVAARLELKHLAAGAEPAVLRRQRRGHPCDGTRVHRSSCNLRNPALLPGQVVGPALAAVGVMFALGQEPLVQLVGEHGDADLAASATGRGREAPMNISRCPRLY
jgi:hypothetical protein